MLMLAMALVALLMVSVTAPSVPRCTVMVFVTPVTPLKFVPLIVTGTVPTDVFVPHVGIYTFATTGAVGSTVVPCAVVSVSSATLHDSAITSTAAIESAVSTHFIFLFMLKLLLNNIRDIKKSRRVFRACVCFVIRDKGDVLAVSVM